MNRVQKGEPYWYITSNCTGQLWKVETAYEYHHDLDDARYNLGNYFNYVEEAEDFRKKITETFKERSVVQQKRVVVRLFDPHRNKTLVGEKFFETEHE